VIIIRLMFPLSLGIRLEQGDQARWHEA
jgi:hypothetical protein